MDNMQTDDTLLETQNEEQNDSQSAEETPPQTTPVAPTASPDATLQWARAEAQRNAQLSQELESLRSMLNDVKQQTAPQPKQLTAEDFEKDFPGSLQKVISTSVESLLEKKLNDSVVPLRNEVRQFTYAQQFSNSYSQAISALPHLQPLASQLEPLVRQALGNFEPNPQNLFGALQAAAGWAAVNNPQLLAQAQTGTPSNAPAVRAATTPPATPSARPSTTPTNKVKLTEEQRKYARDNNWSDEQMWAFINSDDVDFGTVKSNG